LPGPYKKYIGPCKKGYIPVFMPSDIDETDGPVPAVYSACVIVIEYSSVAPSLV
jgi:hypothetical protein